MRHYCLGLLLLSSFAGCCCPAITAARDAARQAQSMNNMMQIGLAAINHHQIHEDWPNSLDDLRDQIPDLDVLLVNPVTMDDPGYEFVKPPVGEGVSWSETIILYQLRNGARDTSLPVGFADGSVRHQDVH